MAAEYIFILTSIILQFLIFHTYYLSDFKIQEIADCLCVRNCFKDLQIFQWKMERNEQDFVWLHASVLSVTYILIGKLMLLLKDRVFWKTLSVKNPSQKVRLALSFTSEDARIFFESVLCRKRQISGGCLYASQKVWSQGKSQSGEERPVATSMVTKPNESREASLLPGNNKWGRPLATHGTLDAFSGGIHMCRHPWRKMSNSYLPAIHSLLLQS